LSSGKRKEERGKRKSRVGSYLSFFLFIAKRFPEEFMFQLKPKESEILRFQFGTSSWGGIRGFPYEI
jgi:hypothetical protein